MNFSFEQLLCQLATSRNNVIVRARSGDTTTFASHDFNKLSGCLSGLGTGTQQGYVLLIDIRHLDRVYLFRFFFQVCFDSSHYTAGLCETVCFADGSMQYGESLCLLQLDVQPVKNGTHLFECQDIIYGLVAAHLFTFGYTWTYEYDFCIRVLLLGDPCRVIHRRTGGGNVWFHPRNMFFYQFDVRRAAGSSHETLSFFQLLQ